MATITTLSSTGTGHVSRANKRTPYLVEWYIDFADVTTAKGSAIAASDVIEVVKLPAGTIVHDAGLQKITAMTGTSTDLTFDFGITGVDADQYVDGWDFDAASVGALATPRGVNTPPQLVTSGDTIDILIATQTNTFTGGKVRAWAIISDVSNQYDKPGIAQLGS